MRRTGTVVKDESGALKLKITRPTECERCGMCKEQSLLLDLPEGDFREGESVDVDMPADRVLKASALTYVMPLALLFAGLLLGEPVSRAFNVSSEAASVILGIAFMALGFVGVKLIAPHMARKGALSMDMTPCGHTISEIKAAQAKSEVK